MANEFLEDEEEDIDEEAAVAKLLASEAPAAAAVPEAEVEAEGDPDVLREYFSRRNKEDMDQMSRAEETSSQNRFIANMGGAASTLANALTGRQNDLSAFEKMAADAKSPVDRVERQQKSKKESDKLVSNYIAQKYKLASAAKTKAEDRAHQTSRDQANRDFLLKRDAAKRAGMPQKLAPEDQAMVSTLSQKTANKISVANQIEAAFKDWERLNDSEKLSRGRSMLKVINSSEGADAIGAEEAKRLGGKLEFALGNLFNSNPVQFGRDLEGFKKDSLGYGEAIRASIDENNKIVQKLTGRAPKMGKFAKGSTGHGGKYTPGQVVFVKSLGKKMRVGEDGDSLEEIQHAAK
jgi:hypothetical protein